MSLSTPFACSARCMFGARATFCQPQSVLRKQHAVFGLHARFKFEKTHSPRPSPVASVRRSTTSDKSTEQGKPNFEVGSASSLQKDPRDGSRSPDASRHVKAAKTPNSYPVNDTLARLTRNQAFRDRARKRRQVRWPGIWTLSALAGTYGALAYLDVKTGVPSSDGSHLPARAQLPQTWELTPEIVRAGLVAGWKELDSLTIGIVVVSVALHLLSKHRPSLWRKLAHTTGEAKWTAFTSPLLDYNWKSLSLNMAALIWFLPSVVHYFDGDLFHTTAFLVSVPLTTSYLMHLAYRLNLVQAHMGVAGPLHLTYALFGIYCVAYAHEKLRMPAGLVFRLDAWHWVVLFWVLQACKLAQTSNNTRRILIVVGHVDVQCDI